MPLIKKCDSTASRLSTVAPDQSILFDELDEEHVASPHFCRPEMKSDVPDECERARRT